MEVNTKKVEQENRLKQICEESGVEYSSIYALLESVKNKRLKRNIYHQQKIIDEIEKSL